MTNIEKLELIILAIDKVERIQSASNIQVAENLDALYTALKSQAKEVILETKLNGENSNVQQ